MTLPCSHTMPHSSGTVWSIAAPLPHVPSMSTRHCRWRKLPPVAATPQMSLLPRNFSIHVKPVAWSVTRGHPPLVLCGTCTESQASRHGQSSAVSCSAHRLSRTTWHDRSPALQEFVGKRDLEASQLGLLVRSRLYEVDLLLRLMTPSYWPEAQHRVSRGTWFVEKGHDWVPLKETVRPPLHPLSRSGLPCWSYPCYA